MGLRFKRFFQGTQRQKITLIGLFLVSALVLLGVFTLKFELIFVLLFFLFCSQILVLDAVERSAQRQSRSVKKVIKSLSAIERKQVSLADRNRPSDSKETNAQNGIEQGASLNSSVMLGICELIDEMDSAESLTLGIKLSQIASIRLIAKRLGATAIYTAERWVTLLESKIGVSASNWLEKSDDASLRSTVGIAVLSPSDVLGSRENLLVRNQIQECAVILLGADGESEKEAIRLLRGFEEVAVLNATYGIRFLYPATRVSNTRFISLYNYVTKEIESA